LSILMRREYLTLMNSTHNTNQLKWKLFTLMIRDEYESWILEIHMLIDNENDDIIAKCLCQIKRWCRRTWRLRYMIIDNSATEQREVSLAFQDMIAEEMKISHFLCRTHFERTLNRKLNELRCRKAKKHLYDALYFRKTKSKCDDSIKKTLNAASEDKRLYIERKWMQTKFKWANYARQHSSMLLQCMITNAMKSWHAFIKKHADDKDLSI
jgi:predicted nucleotidyltransferase component of viral defense system